MGIPKDSYKLIYKSVRGIRCWIARSIGFQDNYFPTGSEPMVEIASSKMRSSVKAPADSCKSPIRFDD